MRTFKSLVAGGIQRKVFYLVLLMVILVMAAYTAVILHQVGSLTEIMASTNARQKEAIATISGEAMGKVIDSNLSTSANLQARIADDMFQDTADAVNMLAEYAGNVFARADELPRRSVSAPNASLDGQGSVQLLSEAGTDLADEAVAERVGLLGNLSEMMLALYDNVELDSIYIAVPEGVMVLVDDHASSKFAADGSITPIPITERAWYTGAVDSGTLSFTDVSRDVFTGQVCVMCSVPIYQGGQLVAVVGADLFLDNMAAYVAASATGGGFVCIVNEQGHIVFSPVESGVFAVAGEGEAHDLRTLGNDELATFVDAALTDATPVTLVHVGRDAYYLVGAPIDTVGWTVVSAVGKSVTDLPTVTMKNRYDSIMSDAAASIDEEIDQAKVMVAVLLVLVMVLAAGGALAVSRRIVRPLEAMTERVESLGGEDLLFTVEDTYRTGDEIEVLAKSFATLSARTLRYVDEVRTVTAEKERIGAELSMANEIQASQLPRLFPAFPRYSEFDVFASMTPAKEVGGDFYDFFLVDDDHVGFVMADVSGKGIPAALFMMVSRVLIKSHMQNGETPGVALANVNDQLCENNGAELFVTVWCAVLEISTGRGIAANAGHEHPALKRAGGEFELVVYRHAPAVALMEGIPYREREFRLNPGDSLFVYTDGVPEATNAADELFGTDRMLEALNVEANAAPEQILQNVQAGVNAFVGGAEQFDDLTMLCITYKGPGGVDADA